MREERGLEMGRREGEVLALRQAVVDLAEAYEVALDEDRRAWISRASLEELGRATSLGARDARGLARASRASRRARR